MDGGGKKSTYARAHSRVSVGLASEYSNCELVYRPRIQHKYTMRIKRTITNVTKALEARLGLDVVRVFLQVNPRRNKDLRMTTVQRNTNGRNVEEQAQNKEEQTLNKKQACPANTGARQSYRHVCGVTNTPVPLPCAFSLP